MEDRGLRLRAEDEEDLKVISACLQDAVVRVGDLAYLPKARRFVLLANRYCWENDSRSRKPCERVRTGLHFEGVTGVKSARVRQSNPEAVVELLAIRFAPNGDGAGHVDLHFAGGGLIRLEVECIDANLRDVTGHWPAKGRPAHELGEG